MVRDLHVAIDDGGGFHFVALRGIETEGSNPDPTLVHGFEHGEAPEELFTAQRSSIRFLVGGEVGEAVVMTRVGGWEEGARCLGPSCLYLLRGGQASLFPCPLFASAVWRDASGRMWAYTPPNRFASYQDIPDAICLLDTVALSAAQREIIHPAGGVSPLPWHTFVFGRELLGVFYSSEERYQLGRLSCQEEACTWTINPTVVVGRNLAGEMADGRVVSLNLDDDRLVLEGSDGGSATLPAAKDHSLLFPIESGLAMGIVRTDGRAEIVLIGSDWAVDEVLFEGTYEDLSQVTLMVTGEAGVVVAHAFSLDGDTVNHQLVDVATRNQSVIRTDLWP